MKKILCFLLIACIVISLIGCNNTSSAPPEKLTYYLNLNCPDLKTYSDDSCYLFINLGEPYALNVDTNDEYVRYYTSDPSVATISDDGVINAVANPLYYENFVPECEITIETPHAGIKKFTVAIFYKEVSGSELIANYQGTMTKYPYYKIKINHKHQYIGEKTVKKCTVRFSAEDANDDIFYTIDKNKGEYNISPSLSHDIVMNGPIYTNEYMTFTPYLFLGENIHSYFKINFIFFFKFTDGTYARCDAPYFYDSN